MRAIGAKPIKGVIFTGAPGTGKTHLARIIANVADAQFYLVSGPTIVSKYVGDSEETLRMIFAAAQSDKRAIIFFDEIDSIASSRETDTNGVGKRLVAQLLTLMDGFESKGNVVDPTAMIAKYGADTVRLFCLFAAPPERDFDWSDSGIEGSSRFLHRVWRLFMDEAERLSAVKACGAGADDVTTPEARDLRRREHLTVKKVTEDMGNRFQFNTAISAVMELVNAMYLSREKLGKSDAENRVFSSAMATVLTLLSPITPHLCEELWQRMGHTSSLQEEAWPVCEESALVQDTVTIALQVNGKLRGTIEVPAGADKARMEEVALADAAVQRHTSGLTIRKVVVVPGKLVNVVAN